MIHIQATMTDISTILSTEAMTLKFPPLPQPIIGEPNLLGIFMALLHIRSCANTSMTRLSEARFKFLVNRINVFQQYTNAFYPDPDQDYPEQPPAPNYADAIDANDRAMIRNEWSIATKNHEECKNMNQALVQRFKLLLDPMYVDAYDLYCQGTDEQNPTFHHMINYFFDEYGESDAADREDNKIRMKKSWNPATDSFEALNQQISLGIQYAIYADGVITDMEAVDIAENLIRVSQ